MHVTPNVWRAWRLPLTAFDLRCCLNTDNNYVYGGNDTIGEQAWQPAAYCMHDNVVHEKFMCS
jgi:hypothetical protein